MTLLQTFLRKKAMGGPEEERAREVPPPPTPTLGQIGRGDEPRGVAFARDFVVESADGFQDRTSESVTVFLNRVPNATLPRLRLFLSADRSPSANGHLLLSPS